MLHVLLDTNIFRNDPKREKLPFKALARMSKSKTLKLHIPYIVEKEFATQLEDHYKKKIIEASGGITSLLKYNLPEGLPEQFAEYNQNLSKFSEEVESFVEDDFVKWADEISAQRYELNAAHTEKVIKAYFSGGAPYKGKKSRKDIPDSFIFEFIKELLGAEGELHLVGNDGCLNDACKNLDNLHSYEFLEDFIASEECQKLLLDTLVIEEFNNIVEYIKTRDGEIQGYIDGAHIDLLAWKEIYGDCVPDDNGEATISGVGSAEGIWIDYDDAVYCGDGELKIPFSFTSEVLTYYYINKSDFYCLSESKQEKICGVQDWNDHVYEVEEYFNVDVFGDLKLPLDMSVAKDVEHYDDLILLDDVVIDAINEIRFSED